MPQLSRTAFSTHRAHLLMDPSGHVLEANEAGDGPRHARHERGGTGGAGGRAMAGQGHLRRSGSAENIALKKFPILPKPFQKEDLRERLGRAGHPLQ
ncbi:hypothetical protein NON00_09750 [Roseomonas sp. GC11]|uniref:hypothetical protein n=1 Tax=Roseomonas sp. GC11 TaxID=2950546 RepID=UPI0021087302|nr:hypothetical protein [Roseomonas sp. GC11]MCQ4160211.1 hypothetical protein [Roseomonas sp. GC11]